MSFVYPFIFIEGNAVSVINLNYSTCIKSFTQKIVKKKLFETKKFFLEKILFFEKNFFEE